MPERILVVDDDDEMLQQWLVRQLEREGYQVTVIATAQGALELAKLQPYPDMVLLDVDLPGLDDLEVTKKLQQTPDLQDVPIIFLANQNTSPDKIAGLEMGGLDYVSKPFNIPELIAKIKTTLEQLKTERDKAQRDLEAYKSNLTENMSHELLTPLNTVLNGVDILSRLAARENLTLFDEVIEMIRRGADELRWLAEDLLLMNHIEEQRLAPFRQPVDLIELVKQVIEQTEIKHTRKSIQFELNSPTQCMVSIHRKHLIHILHHLLDNAAKFSPTDGRPKVMVRRIGTAGAELKVQDRGKGIKSELQKKVFEKFYQIDMSMTRESGGLGLGLYIARILAQLYEGDVTLISKPGAGTTCQLTIPDAKPDWA
ncbi:MAG: hybrid sensor histidine kinase/response regulator [Anaerolineae bacterium]